jgi:Bacteriophage Lambda NinG protein
MKRSGFKKKLSKSMKRTKLRKKGKETISKIQRELWELCKQIIRKKYGNICYTCGRTGLEGSNWHTGHMIAKASLGAYLKYDLRILRPQCYHCNINCGGSGAIFIENMRAREGNEYVNQLLTDRQKTVKASDHYLQLIEEYKRHNEK